jgi:predicted nucleic acid-binding protein
MPDGENKKLNIYLDNCCYNRPYDDQTQLRIELETKAKLFIQHLIEDGKVDLTISSVSRLENCDNPIEERRTSISDFFKNASNMIATTESIREVARRLVDTGLKSKDAAHLSCAISGNCNYFITTDDRLLKHSDGRIKIIDPPDFIKIWESEAYDE